MLSFVITITSNPQSIRKADECIKSAYVNSDLVVQKFDAITPAKDPVAMAKEWGIPTKNFEINPYSRYENCLSCFLSHFSLWQMSARFKTNVMIFEHDAIVQSPIDYDVDFKGVLSFGSPSYGKFFQPKHMGVNPLTSKQYLPGAHAYMVKPSAARKLVKMAKREAEPTDVFMNNRRFSFLEEYWPWPVKVFDDFSTVQNQRGIQAKHSYAKSPETFAILEP